MSSAGHIFDMIKRLQYNADLKKERHDRIRKVLDIYNDVKHSEHMYEFKSKQVGKEELKQIKTKINSELDAERKGFIIKSVTIMTILIIGFLIFMFWLI